MNSFLIVTNFLLKATFETRPTFLSTKGFQSPIDSVLHHGNELLKTQFAVAVGIKNLQT